MPFSIFVNSEEGFVAMPLCRLFWRLARRFSSKARQRVAAYRRWWRTI
jgi:hypothetical protein